jgi:hypothetical protein
MVEDALVVVVRREEGKKGVMAEEKAITEQVVQHDFEKVWILKVDKKAMRGTRGSQRALQSWLCSKK